MTSMPEPTAPPILALGGWKTSGKDEVADRLVARHGWTKLAMGELICEAMLVGNPWIRVEPGERVRHSLRDDTLFPEVGYLRAREIVDAIGYVEAKTIIDFREFMLTFSDGVKQVAGEDVWVRAMRARLAATTGPVVFTGLRMPLEHDLFKSVGAHLVWVDRPGVTAPEGSHRTETSLGPDAFHETLHNDEGLGRLWLKADSLAERYTTPSRT